MAASGTSTFEFIDFIREKCFRMNGGTQEHSVCSESVKSIKAPYLTFDWLICNQAAFQGEENIITWPGHSFTVKL